MQRTYKPALDIALFSSVFGMREKPGHPWASVAATEASHTLYEMSDQWVRLSCTRVWWNLQMIPLSALIYQNWIKTQEILRQNHSASLNEPSPLSDNTFCFPSLTLRGVFVLQYLMQNKTTATGMCLMDKSEVILCTHLVSPTFFCLYCLQSRWKQHLNSWKRYEWHYEHLKKALKSW